MDEKRDQLITYMSNLASNPNIVKLGSVTRIVYRLVAFFIALVVMLVGYFKMLAVAGNDAQMILIFKIVFWGVFISDCAYIFAEILRLIAAHNINKMASVSFNQADYEDLLRIEKVIRKSALLCDVISQFMGTVICLIIGGGFVVGGIYMGATGQGGSLLINAMCIIVFPLMGITAIIIMCSPFFHAVRELFRADSVDWEDYSEEYAAGKQKKEKKIIIKDIKFFLFGSVFFVCGLFAFLEGFTFIPEGDIGQCIGMNIIGIIFMAVGGCVSFFFGVKGKFESR